MRRLNTDLTISPWPGTVVGYESGLFPGGEVHFRIPGELYSTEWVISVNIRNSDDIMLLLLATDALRRLGADSIRLRMPYCAYARQDRVTAPGEAFSLKVFASVINAQNYRSVVCLDPHSNACECLIDRLHIVPQVKLAEMALGKIDNYNKRIAIVAPDLGAHKKAMELALKWKCPLVQASKHRDPLTGELSDPQILFGPLPTEIDHLLMVDDICDGGRTFLHLNKVLKERYPNIPQSLYITHGIFSNGLAALSEAFSNVITANCLLDALKAGVGSLYILESANIITLMENAQ